MACKSRWLLEIPNIIQRLSRLETPVIDRAMCEMVFGVRRRRAIDLMQRFGGYRAGNTVLVDRAALMEQLQRMLAEPAIEQERRRKQRLTEELAKLEEHRRAAAVRIPVNPKTAHCTVADLPAGVRFERGQLTVQYDDVQQLLTRLYELAKAAGNDYDSFAEAAGPLPAPTQDTGGPRLWSAPPG